MRRLYLDRTGEPELPPLDWGAAFRTPVSLPPTPAWAGHIPFGFWLVDAIRPGLLVELGTHRGTSFFAFCQAVRESGLSTRCYAIDTWSGDAQAGHYDESVFEAVRAEHESRYADFAHLVRASFDQAAAQFAPGSIDLLHIDGLHTEAAVRHDFETWLPRLSERAVVLFHDTAERSGDFGVWRLWEELSHRYPAFEFPHSHGLGLLAVGSDPPAAVRQLCGLDAEEAQRLRRLFARLGAAATAQTQLGMAERDLANIGADRDRLAARLVTLETERDAAIDGRNRSAEAFVALEQRRAALQAAFEGAVDERNRTAAALALARATRDDALERAHQAAIERTVAHAEIDRLTAERDLAVDQRNRGAMALAAVTAAHEAERVAFYSSTSWKISKPVRVAGRLFRGVVRRLKSWPRRLTIRLAPVHDLVAQADGFLTGAGIDPQCEIVASGRRLPRGWCWLRLDLAEGSDPLRPVIYGFGAEGAPPAEITLPVMTVGRNRALVRLPDQATRLRFDPADQPVRFRIDRFEIRETSRVRLLARLVLSNPIGAIRTIGRHRRLSGAVRGDLIRALSADQVDDYTRWVALYDRLTPADRTAILAHIDRMVAPPLISVVMPVWNTPAPVLQAALESVIGQIYPHWELCIADDASPDETVRTLLRDYAAREPRLKIHYRPTNGGIAEASNDALALASGSFTALMDHDDLLPAHALYMVAAEIERHGDVDLIYSDEDKLDVAGRRTDPFFKTGWDPTRLLGQNYVNHLGVYRTRILREIGGFRTDLDGSQDYDLLLRVVERTEPARIRHIPHILYHWRIFENAGTFSTTQRDRATAAARRAIGDHLGRLGVVGAEVRPAPEPTYHRVLWPLPEPPPLVSLIVPTRDRVELLRPCVEGLLHRTQYPAIEVLVIDNGSTDPLTLRYLDELRAEPRVRVLSIPGPFNFARINNDAAAAARGSLIAFINNDIDVIGPDWLREMVSHLARPGIGAVGAKLLYGNGTLQHGGVMIGQGGVAGHIATGMSRTATGYFGELVLAREVGGVTAACLLTPRDLFLALGGFDADHLAIAFNDIDYGLRLREAGHRVVWTPHAELYHLESASRGPEDDPAKIARFNAEAAYMERRWGERLRHDAFVNPNLSLGSSAVGFAFPPRTTKPWRQS